MGNCVLTAHAAPDAVPTPTPVPDEEDLVIANKKLDLLCQRLELELELEWKCKSLELKCRRLTLELERSEMSKLLSPPS